MLNGKTMDAVAIERIRAHVPPDGTPLWVADSFGKDSCCIVDLVRRAGVPAEFHHSLTTVDPPELLRFGRKHHPFTVIDKPPKTMWQLVVERGGLPTRFRRWCCEYLKEARTRDGVCVTGVRWSESIRRSKRRMSEQCLKHKRLLLLNPIIDWDESDVWQYIRERPLPYCSLYREGFTRLGCVMCPMQSPKGMARDAARWPRIAAAWRRAAHKAWETNPRVREWHPTPESMWHWWTHGQPGLQKNERTLFDD